MKTSQYFSLPRLGMLFKQDFIENHRQLFLASGFALLLLSVLGISISLNFSAISEDSDFNTMCIHVERGWFIAAFLIFGMIAGSSLFTTLKTPAGRLATLMTPASQLEKFIERWIVVVPCYILLFILIGIIADLVRVGFCEWILHRNATMIQPHEIFDTDNLPRKCFAAMIGFLFLQSFFVLGSVVWQKFAMVKTFWAIVFIGVAYFLTAIGLMEWLHTPGTAYLQPEFLKTDTVPCIIASLITLFNYSVAYLRLRESEIINRW